MTSSSGSNSLIAGRRCFEKGDYARAKHHLANCLRTGNDRGEACVLLGSIYHNEGNFTNSVKCLESAIFSGQDSPDVRQLLCAGLFESKRYNEARLKLELVIEQHPEHWQSRLLLGKLFIETGNLNAAESVLRKSVQIHERAPELWYHLGLALFRLQRHDEAVSVLERAVKLEPDTVPQYHFLLGKTQLEQGFAEKAINSFKRSAAIYPLAELYFPLGSACQLAQRYDTAYHVYEKALDRPINKAIRHRILFHQAEILFEQGEEEDRLGRSHNRYLQAKQKLLRSLEFDPGFNSARHFLALVNIRMKVPEISAQELETLLSLHESDLQTFKDSNGALEILSHRYLQRIHLGYALSLAGRYDEARNALEAAFDDPEIQNEPVVKCRILRRLALVQLQMGDKIGSCSTWRRLSAIDSDDHYGATRALAELETNDNESDG